MPDPVLIIAAHPDDEVLGCGGTMAVLAAAGHEVHVVFLADGVASRGEDREALHRRRQAAHKACALLGARKPEFGDFPDNAMDTVSRLSVTQVIEAHIERVRPAILLTHHAGDVNIDHRRIHEACIPACRPQTGQPIRTLLFFEVASSTEWQIPGSGPVFAPTWFQDISGHLETKLAALHAYAEELRPWPHPRSARAMRALAEWRGATIGTAAAEAFVLGRHLP